MQNDVAGLKTFDSPNSSPPLSPLLSPRHTGSFDRVYPPSPDSAAVFSLGQQKIGETTKEYIEKNREILEQEKKNAKRETYDPT